MTKSQRAEMIDKIVEASGLASWQVMEDLDCLDDTEIRKVGRSLGIWLVIRPYPSIANQSNGSASDGLQ